MTMLFRFFSSSLLLLDDILNGEWVAWNDALLELKDLFAAEPTKADSVIFNVLLELRSIGLLEYASSVPFTFFVLSAGVF